MMFWLSSLIALFMVGFVLLAIELLVIPGFGVVGVLGVIALGAAAVLAWIQVGPVAGLVSLFLALLGTLGLFEMARRSRLGRAIVLTESITASAPEQSLALLVGQVGTAVTPLRPSGTMELAERTVDVVAEARYVDAGTRVRIIDVEGGRVVVEPVTDFEKGSA